MARDWSRISAGMSRAYRARSRACPVCGRRTVQPRRRPRGGHVCRWHHLHPAKEDDATSREREAERLSRAYGPPTDRDEVGHTAASARALTDDELRDAIVERETSGRPSADHDLLVDEILRRLDAKTRGDRRAAGVGEFAPDYRPPTA